MRAKSTMPVNRAETPLVGFARNNRFKQYFFDVGLLSSLNVFEKRYHPQQSVVLSALNVKTHGSRLYIPIYTVGRLRRLLNDISS